MLIPIEHTFTAEISQVVAQQSSVTASMYSLTEKWVLVFGDFNTNIWCRHWKFTWLSNAIQFLLYRTAHVAEVIYLNQFKWCFSTCGDGSAMLPGVHRKAFSSSSTALTSQAHFPVWSRGFKHVFGKVITFAWNTEMARESIFALWVLWGGRLEGCSFIPVNLHILYHGGWHFTQFKWLCCTGFLILGLPVHQWYY